MKEINISIQKNTMGKDYVQIMSGDMIELNIVLNADKITIEDRR